MSSQSLAALEPNFWLNSALQCSRSGFDIIFRPLCCSAGSLKPLVVDVVAVFVLQQEQQCFS